MAALQIFCWPDSATAQRPSSRSSSNSGPTFAPQANPKDFGLDMPDSGPVRQGEDHRVLVKDESRGEVVGQVLVDIGERRVVIMPSGRLEAFAIKDTKPTERSFTPMTKDDLAKELTTTTFKGFKTQNTARYVYVYNANAGFYKATSRILETMYPPLVAYFERQKFPVHPPQMPLVVVMFKTEDEFAKYHPMPPGVVAYYNGVSNYIVMYEQSKLVEIAPELAAKQSIATIAHEGVHQILHNIGVQQRLSRWPAWISEGLPEYFSPTTTDRQFHWKGVGKVNDMRMYELDRFIKVGAAGNGRMVEETAEAPGLTSTGYATAWAMTHYLAARKQEKFFAYLTEVSKRGPFEELNLSASDRRGTADNKALFVKHFGSDFTPMEADLVQYLKSLPYSDPVINQTHYVVMGVISTGSSIRRIVGVTTSPAAVRQWQEEALANVPANLRGRSSFQVRPFPNRDLAEKYKDQWLLSP